MVNAPSTTHIHAPLKGIACGIVDISLFPAQDAIVKWLSAAPARFLRRSTRPGCIAAQGP